jgi:hypothetical protein
MEQLEESALNIYTDGPATSPLEWVAWATSRFGRRAGTPSHSTRGAELQRRRVESLG